MPIKWLLPLTSHHRFFAAKWRDWTREIELVISCSKKCICCSDFLCQRKRPYKRLPPRAGFFNLCCFFLTIYRTKLTNYLLRRARDRRFASFFSHRFHFLRYIVRNLRIMFGKNLSGIATLLANSIEISPVYHRNSLVLRMATRITLSPLQ